MRLTDLAIQKLPLREKGQKTHWDDAFPGFGVRVGTRSKAFVVMFGTQRRLKTFGKYPELSLKDARVAARLVLASPPPKAAIDDFAALTAFLDDCESRLRLSTAARYRFALKRHMEKIDHSTSDPNELKALKAFYNWCIDRGYRNDNPVARRKVIFNIRDRLLEDEEIAELLQYHQPPYSNIVHLLIRTGQRRGQFANFNSIWVKDDQIMFPASVMKSNRIHTIPVTDKVLDLLPPLRSYSGWSTSKARMDKHTGVNGYVLHDIRRYFSSTMAKLGVPLHVTEQLIDHRTQVSGVAAIYNLYSFLPEMKDALVAYEAHLETILDS